MFFKAEDLALMQGIYRSYIHAEKPKKRALAVKTQSLTNMILHKNFII
jgi:hypothetical protein